MAREGTPARAATTMRAAVLRRAGDPLEVREVLLDPPAVGIVPALDEVLVHQGTGTIAVPRATSRCERAA